MYYLPILLFSSLVLGIYIGYFLNFSPSIYFILFLFALNIFFRNLAGILILLILIFSLGTFISPKPHNLSINERYKFLECDVSSLPKGYKDGKVFSCYVTTSDIPQINGKDIKVFLKDINLKDDIYYRTKIAFIGNLKTFDDKIYAYPLDGFIIVDNSENPFYYFFFFRRELIERYFEKALSYESYSLGKALIFGDRDEISPEIKEAFIRTGLIHILAISGFHVAIFLIILSFFLSFFPRKVKRIFPLFFLPIYGFLTGFNIPVLRAVFMAFLYFLGRLFSFKVDVLLVLFWVGFIFLLLSPEALFSASFQLSFMATLGIILFVRGLSAEKKLFNLFILPFLISLVATLYTAPILVFNFGGFSLSGIIFTPLLVPIIYLYLVFSTFNLFTAFSITPVIWIMDYIGDFFLRMVQVFDSLYYFLSGYITEVYLLIFYYLFIIMIFSVRIHPFLKVFTGIFLLSIFLFLSKDSSFIIHSQKGKRYPDIFIQLPEKDCIFSIDRDNGFFFTLLKKSGCRNQFFFSKDIYVSGVNVRKYKKGYIIKTTDLKIFIKNKNLKLNFSNYD